MRIHRANVGLLTGYRSPTAWHLLARITGATPGTHVFKRYQIVTPTEQRAVADRLAAYRAAQPTTATVVPMKRVDGAAL